MKKALLLTALLIAASILFAACGASVPEDTSPATEPGTASVETGIQTEPETETETEEETKPPVVRPSADGQEVLAYDVSFYLPSDITANEWNGMLGVYDFYTGEYSGSHPSGMDFTLTVSDESNADGDLNAYARDASLKISGADAEPEEVDFNGTTWLRFTVNEGAVNYYTIFNGALYEITTMRGGDTQENFDAARAMLEETLFLAVNEDW